MNKKLLLRILLRFSELLFDGNYITRWEKGKAAWNLYLGSVNMKNLKNLSNKAKAPVLGTLCAWVHFF